MIFCAANGIGPLSQHAVRELGICACHRDWSEGRVSLGQSMQSDLDCDLPTAQWLPSALLRNGHFGPCRRPTSDTQSGGAIVTREGRDPRLPARRGSVARPTKLVLLRRDACRAIERGPRRFGEGPPQHYLELILHFWVLSQ